MQKRLGLAGWLAYQAHGVGDVRRVDRGVGGRQDAQDDCGGVRWDGIRMRGLVGLGGLFGCLISEGEKQTRRRGAVALRIIMVVRSCCSRR